MKDLILLTGATGFVGRQVLKTLRERGKRIRAVLREGSQGQLANFDAVESIVTTPDLFSENAGWWAEACKEVHTIINVAWYAEPGRYLQSEKNLDCLIGTLQMANGAVQAGVERFIGIGTCFEYDLAGGTLSVKTPLCPLTPYASTKAAAFMALSQCLPQQDIEFAWCRLFYLFGEGEDARRLVPYVHERLSKGQSVELTSGTQIRDFLDVREAGEKIVEVALSDRSGAINICSGIPITVRQLVEGIADSYNRRDLLNFGARPDNLIDPPKVVGVL